MSASTKRLTVGLTRWWVRLYTVGLPSGVKDARRAEIDSDLWEQVSEDGARARGLQVFSRWLLGIPADLSWHFEQVLVARRQEPGRELGQVSRGSMAFMGIATLMAAFTVLVGVLVSFGVFQNHVGGYEVPRFVWGIVGSSAGVIILAGLFVSRRLPVPGGIIVLLGALPLTVILSWTILLPILWLLLAALVVFKALSSARKGTILS